VHEERVSLTAEEQQQPCVSLMNLSKIIYGLKTKKDKFSYMSALWPEQFTTSVPLL
jgi:hypothetical protein